MKKLTLVISVLLAFALLFSFAGCSLGQEEEESTTVINVRTPLPTDITSSYDEESNVITDTTYSQEALAANTQTIFEYFDIHMNEIKGSGKAVKMSQKKSVGKAQDANGESLPISENEYVNAAFSLCSQHMLHNDSAQAEAGEDLTDFMPVKGESYVSALTLDEVKSATCVDEGTERKIIVTLNSPSLPETLEKAYDMENVDDVLEEFKKADKYLTLGSPVITYRDCEIIITANVETDEVTKIEYVKNADIAVDVTGSEGMGSIGTVTVKANFSLSNKVTYEIISEEA